MESERPYLEAGFYQDGKAQTRTGAPRGVPPQRLDGQHRLTATFEKTSSGERRAYVTPFWMPSSGRACRPGSELTDGSLGTIFFFPFAPCRFLLHYDRLIW